MATFENVQRPVSDLQIVARISIPGSPDWVAIDEQAVWASNSANNSLARIDPVTSELVTTVAVSRGPCSGLAAGFGSVWSPSCQEQRIDRVDSATNALVAQIPAGVADSEGAIAAAAGSVWMMTDRNGTLSRIDPSANKVVNSTRLDSESFAIAATPQAVWITSTANARLLRVDPQTSEVLARIPTGPSPRFLCTTDDSVWVLNQGDGTVTRIDTDSHNVIATIEVGNNGPGGDIAAGEGAVWVTAVNVPLTRIDPATNKVTSQFVGSSGDALRVGHGSLWLCSFFLQEMWRVKPPPG
jgi:virginiamycin B lyase